MNHKIANIIVDYIKDLTWVDKITGLTQIAQVNQGDVVKRFPISCDMTYDEACKVGCYDELMPDSSRSSVLFFEDGSFSLIRQEGGKLYYESRLRLICWLNYTKIIGGCGSSGDYVIDIIKALPALPQNIGDMLRLSISVTSQVPRTSGIFSKYTFDEGRSQYLMSPYDFFSLNIRTEFYIVPECVTPDPKGCVTC